MSITRIDPGARLSAAVVHKDTVYLAGQVATAAIDKGVAEQTREVLEIIDSVLAKAGTDKSKLLWVQIWLPDIGTFDAMNAVWDAWVDPANPPARACGESRLATPDYRVEIIAVAAR